MGSGGGGVITACSVWGVGACERAISAVGSNPVRLLGGLGVEVTRETGMPRL